MITSCRRSKDIHVEAHPSTQGATSTTGNIVRRCISWENDEEQYFLYWVLTVIPPEYREHITQLHTHLGAILSLQ